MTTTVVTGIILERDGETKIAYPLTPEEKEEARAIFEEKGLDINSCNCGDEVCHYGRVWRCAYGPSGRCEWFRSDWQCN